MNRLLLLAIACLSAVCALAQAPAPTTKPAALQFVHPDIKAKRVVVDCETVNAPTPLEFLCVLAGTNEHEAILRTKAKPSDIHLSLLMLGLKPGEPVRYSPATEKWIAPQGPPIQISVEFQKNGQTLAVPAWKLFRDIKSKKPMEPRTWLFVGSKVYNSGQYAADITGYVVSIVNFDLSLIDVPQITSSSNELLEYELNPDVVPPIGTPVKMILEPAGAAALIEAPAAPAGRVSLDQAHIDRLRDQWKNEVAAHAREVQNAATSHYRVISDLRAEQNRLIDEAERVGRVIDQLERQYQDLTAPRPTTQPAKDQ